MSEVNTYSDEWSWIFSSFRKPQPEQEEMDHKKSLNVAIVLSLLLGWTGIDRFYTGKIGTGILKLITLGGLGIWWIIDVFLLIGKTPPEDISGNELKETGKRYSSIYLFLTVFASSLGVHYYYIGLKNLAFTRLGAFLAYFVLIMISIDVNITIINFIISVLAILLFVWALIDLYLAITGKIHTDVEGNELIVGEGKYQSICLLFALIGGIIGFDRFYLGHRVLGILKLFTFGGFFMWYFLDIVLAILNVHKDSNGNSLLQE